MHNFWILRLVILPYFPLIYFVPCTTYALYVDDGVNSALTINNVIAPTDEHSEKATVVRFADSNTVYGILVFDGLLAIALDSSIVVRSLSPSVSSEDLLRIPLPAPIRSGLLEFKFVNYGTLLYCDSTTCRFAYFKIYCLPLEK
ncbi:unnamed protein product [Gongylonema pulchrum]|uniref:Secreted protein n=1 Tax=Gongylonema pulchrum TaxID=637853 RepID=A0A183EWL2_9BILA|nr:unnamed protein product [Gongylonema pulchrum]